MTAEEIKIENLILNGDEDDDVVTPWIVESSDETGIDYDKLISESRAYLCINIFIFILQ